MGGGAGHRHGRHKRAGRRPAAQWRPRSHVFLLSPGLCDLLVGALGPAIGRLCAQPGSRGGGGGQGASSLRGPLTQLLQPQTLTPGLREAHQTRKQRGRLLHCAPGAQGPEAESPPLPERGGLSQAQGLKAPDGEVTGKGAPSGRGEGGGGPWSQCEEPGRLEGGEGEGAASLGCLGPTPGP